jgi:hypothetical protein
MGRSKLLFAKEIKKKLGCNNGMGRTTVEFNRKVWENLNPISHSIHCRKKIVDQLNTALFNSKYQYYKAKPNIGLVRGMA